MTVQELIDALTAVPQHQRHLQARVEAEGVHDVPIERVELRNIDGAFIGIIIEPEFIVGGDLDGDDGAWDAIAAQVGA